MIAHRSFLFAVIAWIALFMAAALPARAAEADPKDFVTQLATNAIDTMTGKGIPDAERMAKFRTLFTGSVDLAEIGKFVLGRHWKGATVEQQQDFLKLFEDMVVLTWSTRFKDYGGSLKHHVTSVSLDPARNTVIVDSLVDADKQAPIQLQWRLKAHDGSFKVTDLIINGAAMSITYYDEYRSILQNHGGKVDNLIKIMREKVAEIESSKAR
ncbi:ABC-type transport system [Candidatus Terasakiella magnetica]|nr:ABC-type transport system [Candidatus Terasakiella magnetica]